MCISKIIYMYVYVYTVLYTNVKKNGFHEYGGFHKWDTPIAGWLMPWKIPTKSG